MNENAKKWVAALRSGEYRQTAGNLRVSDGYCCLGVACEISGLGRWVEGESVYAYEIDGFEIEFVRLPRPVREWLGLRSSTGEFGSKSLERYGSDVRELTSINDGGATFAEIADIIEANWNTLGRKS